MNILLFVPASILIIIIFCIPILRYIWLSFHAYSVLTNLSIVQNSGSNWIRVIGDERFWRKPEIIADSIGFMVNENPDNFSGCQLIDQFYLRGKGIVDFSKYQCVPGCEPPTMDEFFDEN